MVWASSCGIFYYGIRKYIYELVLLDDKEQMISDALDVYLASFERAFGTHHSLPRPPVKAVG